MTIHTLLIIDPKTLQPEKRHFKMRSGSLTALKKLSEFGFLPTGNLTDAGPDILQLLAQEEIPFRVTTAGKSPVQNPANESGAVESKPVSGTSAGQADASAADQPANTAGPYAGLDTCNEVTVTLDPSGDLAVSPGLSGTGEEKTDSGHEKTASGNSGNEMTASGHKKAETSSGSAKSSRSEIPEGSTLFSGWTEAAKFLLTGFRTARHTRKTGETDISVFIRLDGSGESHIDTGLPFYDHMLEQIAKHGYMDLDITCRGDLQIDEHHTIEDTAITLGEAMAKALGDKRGIGRYGFVVAMDESRALAAIDLSGRPWCVFEGKFQREKVGEFPTEMTSHFFHSLAMALKATLHVSVKGDNDHHQIEACFKALARCLRQAVDRNEKYREILPSSKGLL